MLKFTPLGTLVLIMASTGSLWFTLATPALAQPVVACADNFDNDGDGAVDFPADTGCDSPQDNNEADVVSECQDNQDNDSDGLVDLTDPGCSSAQDQSEGDLTSQCQDGIDNDGDGLKDTEDPGCFNKLDNNESDGTTQCQDGVDNDGDGMIDLADPGCKDKPSNNNEAAATTECQDGKDNDRDGLVDLADPGCSNDPQGNDERLATSECQDGVDNDGDGLKDTRDPGCVSKFDLSESDGTTECQDGFDNDGDGLIDLADPGCKSDKKRDDESKATSQCQDSKDNDRDGLVDLADPGCNTPQDDNEKAATTACQDGIDNDGDGKKDTKDPGCFGKTDASEQNTAGAACDNGRDDDGDGLVDMLDPGCKGDPERFTERSETLCDNGRDDDLDGLIDLNDPGCSHRDDTTETNELGPKCDNGLDDDNDGLTDTRDSECTGPSDTDERLGTQCNNGRDDDADGLTDYPNDPHCLSKDDPDESRHENASDDHNVRLELSDSKDPVDPGEEFTYTLTIVNLEDKDIVKATENLELDEHLDFVSASHDGFELQDGLIRWRELLIQRHSSIRLMATVRVKDDYDRGGTIMSRAFGSPEDDEETEVENIRRRDLRLDVTANQDEVLPGGTVTYTISVKNNDNGRARTDVRAFLPRGLEFVSATNSARDDVDIVRWKDLEILAGATTTLSLTARVEDDVDNGDRLELEVMAGDEEDKVRIEVTENANANFNDNPFLPDPALPGPVGPNNVGPGAPLPVDNGPVIPIANGPGPLAPVALPVATAAPGGVGHGPGFAGAGNTSTQATADNITLRKSVDRREVQPNSTFGVTLTLQNTGQATQRTLTVQETLSGNITVEDAGNGTVRGNSVIWVVPTLEAGSTLTYRYRARVNSGAGQQTVNANTSVSGGDLSRTLTTNANVNVITRLPQTGAAELSQRTAANEYVRLKQPEPEAGLGLIRTMMTVFALLCGGYILKEFVL